MKSSIWAVVLAAALLAPFWNKAFTIDDPTILGGAEQMLRDPFHPSAFEMVWGTSKMERASTMYPNIPVAYILLIPVILAGGAEWVAHLTQFILLAIGILFTVKIAYDLGFSEKQAQSASLLLVTTPTLLAMAGTAMPDIPTMTFAVLTVERLLAFHKSAKIGPAIAASVFLLMGILCRPHVAFLGAAAAILFWDFESDSKLQQKILPWLTRLWPIALTFVLLLAIMQLTQDPGAPTANPFKGPLSFTGNSNGVINLISFLMHWVLVLPLAIPWLVIRRRNLPYSWLIAIVPIIAIVIHFFSWAPRWTTPIAILGCLALLDILQDGWNRRDRIQLFLFAWLMVPLLVIPYLHLPSKYLVACAPAVALLVGARIQTRLTGICMVAGACLGILILSADAKLAGLWRDGATNLIVPRVKAHEKVWFAGSWGYYWYAEKAGAQVLASTPPFPMRGDIVVANTSALRDELKSIPKYKQLQSWEDRTPGGRIFGGNGQAGFYSNYFGFLPWTYGADVITGFKVLEVE